MAHVARHVQTLALYAITRTLGGARFHPLTV